MSPGFADTGFSVKIPPAYGYYARSKIMAISSASECILSLAPENDNGGSRDDTNGPK